MTDTGDSPQTDEEWIDAAGRIGDLPEWMVDMVHSIVVGVAFNAAITAHTIVTEALRGGPESDELTRLLDEATRGDDQGLIINALVLHSLFVHRCWVDATGGDGLDQALLLTEWERVVETHMPHNDGGAS